MSIEAGLRHRFQDLKSSLAADVPMLKVAHAHAAALAGGLAEAGHHDAARVARDLVTTLSDRGFHRVGIEDCMQRLETFMARLPHGAERPPAGPAEVWATALVVDDDSVSRAVLRRQLEQGGVRVVEAEGLVDLHTRLEEHKLDAIVLDVHLKDGSGIDAVRQLRRDPAWKGLPILIITGDGQALADAKAAGATGAITKPARASVLLNFVRFAIEHQNGNPKARPSA